jgi:outer membrane protein assembly factor BamA
MYCRRMLLGFGVLVLFVGQGPISRLSAQSNACPPIAEDQPRGIDVIVDQVELHGNPLSDSDTAALVRDIEQTHFTASSTTDDDWANEIMEVPIRGTFQDNGYFRVLMEGSPYLIHVAGDGLHYGLRVEIESGPQYRLGDARLVNVREDKPLAVSEILLRQQIEWNAGDLFSVSKIRRALKSMTDVYRSKGFIDMTPEPEFRIHEGSRIDLIFKIDEGPRYRIAEVAVLGLEAGVRKQLLLPQSAGDYFSSDLWWTFFRDNQSRFRQGATFESVMSIFRNTRDSTVQLGLDFAACPQPELPAADRPHLVRRTDR